MLQFIREHAQGWIAWVIVALIAVPFALWGINKYFGPDPDAEVASVNGEKVSLSQFRRFYFQQLRKLQASQDNKFNINDIDQARFKRESLDVLTQEELLLQELSGLGMRISDGQLAAGIQATGVFHQDGRFSSTLYEQRLGQLGYTPEAFEVFFRRRMLLSQLGRGISQSAVISENEIEHLLKLRYQKRDIDWLVLSADTVRDSVTVSEAEIEGFFTDRRERFVSPERVSIDYIELAVADLTKDIKISEQDMRARYKEQEHNYVAPEQRRARHILILVPGEGDTGADDKARQEAEELAAQINAGGSFEEIAKAHSQDPGSATQGGDLGFFGRGVMDSAFEDAVFALEPGQVSAPVRTAFGYHIIRLEEVTPASVRPFEEVRDAIEHEMKTARAEQIFYEQAEQMANLTYEHPDTLVVAAEALEIEVRSTPLFTVRGGEGISKEGAIIKAAFSDEVLESGNNSEPIELGNSRIVVLRKRQYQPSRKLLLDDVRKNILAQLTAEKTAERMKARGDVIIDRLRAGESSTEIAGAENAQWQSAAGVLRDSTDAPPQIVRATFRSGRMDAAGGGPIYTGTATGDGDYAVIRINAVHDADPAALDEETRTTARSELQQLTGASDLAGLVDSLKARADITTFPDRL